MKKEWEINARKEGYEYFDETFGGLMSNNKFKREMYLNTGFWWFRRNKKRIYVFTSEIGGTDYLYTVFTKETEAKIFYKSIAPFINFEEITNHYNNTKVEFVKINFEPQEVAPIYTCKNKKISYTTIVLADNDTVILDKKSLGTKKDSYGDRRVYRVKDVDFFDNINNSFIKHL